MTDPIKCLEALTVAIRHATPEMAAQLQPLADSIEPPPAVSRGRAADRIMRVVEAGGRCGATTSHITRSTQLMPALIRNEELDALVRAGRLVRRIVSGGGRPAVTYYVAGAESPGPEARPLAERILDDLIEQGGMLEEDIYEAFPDDPSRLIREALEQLHGKGDVFTSKVCRDGKTLLFYTPASPPTEPGAA